MEKPKLHTVSVSTDIGDSAKLEFTVKSSTGNAKITILVDQWQKNNKDVTSSSHTLVVDDADLIKEGRRKLHEFATLLATQTKDWAAS